MSTGAPSKEYYYLPFKEGEGVGFTRKHIRDMSPSELTFIAETNALLGTQALPEKYTEAAERMWANKEPEPTKEQPHCPYCDSDEVGLDANAVWDPTKQDWVLGGTHDSKWCNACECDFKEFNWKAI